MALMMCCLFAAVKPGSPILGETAAKDSFVVDKFVMDDTVVHKETERMIIAKDTGKQFRSAAPGILSSNGEYLCYTTVLLIICSYKPLLLFMGC